MKVLSIVALFVAVAAAQSGDDDPMVTEIPEDGGWSANTLVQTPEFSPVALRLRGPGGKRPGHHFRRNHTVFSPIFKIDNVTFQNSTVVQLKEGENIFFLLKAKRAPFKQYLKLTYNSTEPNHISMEFGELKRPTRRFIPAFKVENVTFESATSVQLMEGDNLFLKLKGRGPRHLKNLFHGRPHGPPFGRQYVKLTYSSTVPNQVSVEYGTVKDPKR